MKGNKRRNVWLALGLVAMACLVLAGCPHSGLLEGGGGGGLANGGGGRGGGDGVQLVITNFVADGAASRSASWLGGPQKTIAPEHIDLTNPDRIAEYIFVAYGYGSGVYGPEIIDISPNSGTAGLNIQGSGEWEITVEAYDWQKLVGTGITGADKNAIITAHKNDPKPITDKRTTAMVLSGSGLVDLGSGTQVTVTLTPDRVTADGEVDIAVQFTTKGDVDAIFASTSPYVVTAELKNLVTQDGVMVNTDPSTVTLFAIAGKPGGPKDEDPQLNYQYNKYNKETKTYTLTTVSTNQGQTKVLRYNPKAQAGGNLKIPKGKYGLLVTVMNTDDNSELYRADWDVSVDGNRVTQGVFEIKDLLGTKPTKPAGLEVYWEKPKTTDQLEGYNATFRWGSSDFHAVGYTLEIANVTSIYEHTGGGNTQVSLTTGGPETFTDAAALWTILDNPTKIDVPTREKLVTTLDWRTTPQNHLEIPRWMEGSLLGTSTSITLRLNTGNVYTARIRADNGTKNFSDWTYVGEAITSPPSFPGTVPQPTKFDFGNTKGIFDLLKFTYNLGETDMWGLTNNRDVDFMVDSGADTQVQGESLLQVEQYEPGIAAELEFSFAGNTVGAKQNDYVLTAVGSESIVRSWLGWQNTKNGDGTLFGPVNTTTPAGGTWTKADWKYEGYSDLVLIPVGAGGNSIGVKANTAGTFDVLSLDTVGFNITINPTTITSKIVAGLPQYNNLVQTGVYRNTAGDKLVLVMERVTTQTPVQFLDLPFYVSVGDKNAGDNTVKDTLTDKNGDSIKVTDVSVTVERNNNKYRYSSGFTTASTGVSPAYSKFSNAESNGLAGMGSGQYTLRVKISVGQGYTPEFQLPMYILYLDQVAATPNIP